MKLVHVGFAVLAASVACSGAADRPSSENPPSTPTAPVTPAPVTPVIVLSSDSLVANGVAGENPLSASFRISAGNSTPLSGVSLGTPVYESGSGWLTVSSSATSDGVLASVVFDARALVPGTYAAGVTVSAADAKPAVIRVKFLVRARPVLSVLPGSVTLVASTRDSTAEAIVALASSSDAIGGLTLGAPSCNGGLESRVSATLAAATTPTTISLRVNTKGLGITSYACTIQVATSQTLVDSASRFIQTTLRIRPTPVLALDRTDLNIAAIAGDQSLGGSVGVTNAGDGRLDGLSIGTIQYKDAATNWITSATLDQSVAPAKATVIVSAARLTVGSYTADLPIQSSADGAINSPQTVHVKLDVAEPGAPPPPFFPQPPAPPGPGTGTLVAVPSSVSGTCHYGQQLVLIGRVTLKMTDNTASAASVIAGSSSGNPLAGTIGMGPDVGTTPYIVDVYAYCYFTTGSNTVTFTWRNDRGQTASISGTVNSIP